MNLKTSILPKPVIFYYLYSVEVVAEDMKWDISIENNQAIIDIDAYNEWNFEQNQLDN